MTEFKQHLSKKLRSFVAFMAGFMITFAIGYTFYEEPRPLETDSSSDAMAIRESAPHSPSHVLEKHRDECWTANETAKAELPGAAIVQFKSGKTVYTRDHILVDEAFNEVLAAVGYGDKTSDRLDVIALCI